MKRFSLILFIAFSLLFALASCGPEPEHECSFGEWQTVEGKEATCAKKGQEIRVCLEDSTHTETREVPMLEHTFEGQYYNDETSHWQMCSGCGERGDSVEHESESAATSEHAEICMYCEYEMNPKLHFLSNKKIIFIGNSHTYFGGTVKEIKQDVLSLASRINDQGYFYQLCKANGATNVQVTNWTFGGHSLKDIFSGNCQANRDCGNGTDHFSYLTDNNYDYVIFQQGSTDGSSIMEWTEYMINFFKEGNPNTKFVMLVQARAHNDGYSWLSDLDEIENKGVTIVDWGAVVYDLYSGNVKLSGADTLPLTKTSFVIAKTASDGYHPNLLAGYLTTVMTYSAITGEKAAGQKYAFCTTTRSVPSFINSYYKVDTTNMQQVFQSKETMYRLQELVDRYLAEKKYREY